MEVKQQSNTTPNTSAGSEKQPQSVNSNASASPAKGKDLNRIN